MDNTHTHIYIYIFVYKQRNFFGPIHSGSESKSKASAEDQSTARLRAAGHGRGGHDPRGDQHRLLSPVGDADVALVPQWKWTMSADVGFARLPPPPSSQKKSKKKLVHAMIG